MLGGLIVGAVFDQITVITPDLTRKCLLFIPDLTGPKVNGTEGPSIAPMEAQTAYGPCTATMYGAMATAGLAFAFAMVNGMSYAGGKGRAAPWMLAASILSNLAAMLLFAIAVILTAGTLTTCSHLQQGFVDVGTGCTDAYFTAFGKHMSTVWAGVIGAWVFFLTLAGYGYFEFRAYKAILPSLAPRGRDAVEKAGFVQLQEVEKTVEVVPPAPPGPPSGWAKEEGETRKTGSDEGEKAGGFTSSPWGADDNAWA
ncbi:hypothetical protein HK104_008506 [Borealophlyctis nickersoniae]|nr:hypothetical protein HK104_008506 [Borealophlyctis nickersoniae]